jgi:hypothetical protein
VVVIVGKKIKRGRSDRDERGGGKKEFRERGWSLRIENKVNEEGIEVLSRPGEDRVE